jgi:quercetin dioxygenase-like cupin family protein
MARAFRFAWNKERLMRWRPLVALLITLALAPLAIQGISPGARAQDATPPAGQAVEGVTARTLAGGSLDILTPGTASLNLGRIALAPGAVLPFNPQDPAAVLIYVASGELTFKVATPMTIARRVEPGTPVPSGPESVEANTEFVMRDGDSALFPPAIGGEVRNNGADEAIAWVVNVAVQPAAGSTPTP